MARARMLWHIVDTVAIALVCVGMVGPAGALSVATVDVCIGIAVLTITSVI